MLRKFTACLVVTTCLGDGQAPAATITVNAKTMIHAAAGNGVPDPLGYVPALIELPAGTGRVLNVAAVIGSVTPGAGVPAFGADGGNFLDLPYNVWSFGGIAGIRDTSVGYTMPLVGVFTAGRPAESSRPADRDVTGEKDLLVMPTLLNQPFFIGDGVTSAGVSQVFPVPDSATHLAFGFADAIPAAGIFDGPAGAYGDNVGALTVTYAVVPEPAVGSLLLTGALVLWRRKKKLANPGSNPGHPLEYRN